MTEFEKLSLEYQNIQTRLLYRISVQNQTHLNNAASTLLGLNTLMTSAGVDQQSQQHLLKDIDRVIESTNELSKYNDMMEEWINMLETKSDMLKKASEPHS